MSIQREVIYFDKIGDIKMYESIAQKAVDQFTKGGQYFSNYEINVALNGRHFFATAERSLKSSFDVVPVLAALLEKFPASQGYAVSLSAVSSKSKSIDVEG